MKNILAAIMAITLAISFMMLMAKAAQSPEQMFKGARQPTKEEMTIAICQLCILFCCFYLIFKV